MWRADCSPGVCSLMEVITIKQITTSFLSPTMSELETSGPRPKIASSQAQPATDPDDVSRGGKEGTGLCPSPGSLLSPAAVPWPTASSHHHCLHLRCLLSLLTHGWDKHPSLGLSTECQGETTRSGGVEAFLFPFPARYFFFKIYSFLIEE